MVYGPYGSFGSCTSNSCANVYTGTCGTQYGGVGVGVGSSVLQSYDCPTMTARQESRPHGLGDGRTWFSRGATALPYRFIAQMYPRDTTVQTYSQVPAAEAANRQPMVTLLTQAPVPRSQARSFIFPDYAGGSWLGN